jgi:hypothetical protein
MLLAQHDTAAEVVEGRPHPALRVGRIGEAAQRASLRLRRTATPCILQTLLMFLPTAVDIAERKEDIAAQMMEMRKLADHVAAFSGGLRKVEQFDGLGQALAYAKAFGKSELRAA